MSLGCAIIKYYGLSISCETRAARCGIYSNSKLCKDLM